MNILLVDDEKLLIKGLKKSLVQEGFQVYEAYDGQQALDQLHNESVDFIILDIMLPVIDGMTLCKKIRQTMDIPIIILTAKDDHIDRILGLELGADDYITKPFHTRELIARIKAVSRRFETSRLKASNNNHTICTGNLKLNILEQSLFIDENEVLLTSKEYEILNILMTNRGVVFSRDRLFELAWNELSCDSRTVDVHISKLREKIEKDPSNPYFIKTKWGSGYFFRRDSL